MFSLFSSTQKCPCHWSFCKFGLRPFKIQRLKKCVTVRLQGRSFEKSVPVKLEGRRGTGKWEAARERLNFGGWTTTSSVGNFLSSQLWTWNIYILEDLFSSKNIHANATQSKQSFLVNGQPLVGNLFWSKLCWELYSLMCKEYFSSLENFIVWGLNFGGWTILWRGFVLLPEYQCKCKATQTIQTISSSKHLLKISLSFTLYSSLTLDSNYVKETRP